MAGSDRKEGFPVVAPNHDDPVLLAVEKKVAGLCPSGGQNLASGAPVRRKGLASSAISCEAFRTSTVVKVERASYCRRWRAIEVSSAGGRRKNHRGQAVGFNHTTDRFSGPTRCCWPIMQSMSVGHMRRSEVFWHEFPFCTKCFLGFCVTS